MSLGPTSTPCGFARKKVDGASIFFRIQTMDHIYPKKPAFSQLLRDGRNILRKKIAQSIQKMPVSSSVIGPPKGFYRGLPDFAVNRPSEGDWGKIFKNLTSGYEISLPFPKGVVGGIETVYQNRHFRSEPAFGCLFKEARIYDSPFVFIAPDDRFIASLSSFLGSDPQGHCVFDKPHLGKVHRVKGRTLLLYDSNNYWHFIQEGLPRLRLAEQAGHSLRDFDHILAPHPLTSWQTEIFQELGLDVSRVLARGGRKHYLFDEIFVGETSFETGSPIWTFPFLQEKFASDPRCENFQPSATSARRIYITRRKADTRRIANEETFLSCLVEQGFEILEMEGMRFSEQKRAFQNAEIVISSQGAALTNLLFCRPECRILVLWNEEAQQFDGMPSNHIDMWWVACALLGLPYVALFGKSCTPGKNRHNADIVIDRKILLETISRII